MAKLTMDQAERARLLLAALVELRDWGGLLHRRLVEKPEHEYDGVVIDVHAVYWSEGSVAQLEWEGDSRSPVPVEHLLAGLGHSQMLILAELRTLGVDVEDEPAPGMSETAHGDTGLVGGYAALPLDVDLKRG